MRSRTPPDLAGYCARCFVREAHCICGAIEPVDTRCRFLVLRHAKEVWSTSNTARLAALALPRCEVITYGGKGAPLDFERLVPENAWLLYPGGTGAAEPPPDATVVVLDGSWTQARRMAHRVPRLRGLRRLSFVGDALVKRLRQPTVPGGMSTLEAIAACVAKLEGADKARPLERLYAARVQADVKQGRLPTEPEPRPS